MQTVLAVSMRFWWSVGMVPVKVTWVQFPARISTAYSKLLPINDLILIKHLHICSYKFSYRMSDQEIWSAMLYISSATFLGFFPPFMQIWPFQEKSYFKLYLKIFKQWIYVLCNLYLINQLKSCSINLRNRLVASDICFSIWLLLSSIFTTLYQYSS